MRVAMWVAAAVIGVTPIAAAAQKVEGWKVRLDKADQDEEQCGPKRLREPTYSVMSPGWHVTMHSTSGILYDPAWRATGNYQVEAPIFLFPDSEAEGYGLFLGGKDLDGAGQSYLYLQLRRDGKYAVMHRAGAAVHELRPWTDHPAIQKPDTGAVKNIVAARIDGPRIAFLVNGVEVMVMEQGNVAGGGIGQAGLRFSHGINAHVLDVKVTAR